MTNFGIPPAWLPLAQATLSEALSLSSACWQNLMGDIRVLQASKGQLLLRAGEPSDWVGAVVEGLARKFYVDMDGREFTQSFASEGQILMTCHSVLSGEPSVVSIAGLEKTTVLAVPFQRLAELGVEQDCTKLAYCESARRERDLVCISAGQRYERFCTTYRAVLSRIPQYLVASHLGISPESLSRLRRRRGVIGSCG